MFHQNIVLPVVLKNQATSRPSIFYCI